MHTDDDLDRCNTLGELIALRHTIMAVCRPCNKHTVLDLEALATKYGADAKVRRVALKLKCSGCGQREGEILVSPHTGGLN